MTNQDALVAEVVGYTRHETPTFEQKHLFPFPHYWLAPRDNEWLIEPPPFDSAPTAATDQIVLEWVQGQNDVGFILEFENALHTIIDVLGGRTWTGWKVFFLNYKPGMYAQALLAIQEERGE